MFEHLRFDSSSVIPKSNAGQFAVELLDLNEPGTVILRETVVESVERWTREARRCAAGIQRLNSQLTQTSSSNAKAAEAKIVLQGTLDAIVQKLALYGVTFEG